MEIYHRVIVGHSNLEYAKMWLHAHNIAYTAEEFGEQQFQFIFNENKYSDLTCAAEFAKLYSVHNEVRTYSSTKGPVVVCSVE